ncbi:MAG: Zn-dependent hydrolase [Synergistota bacterium]|nr:Zn-dependent hydrolase [Synergistota bacterium]
MERIVSKERIRRDIETIASFGRDGGGGRTSFSYGEEDGEVRKYLYDRMNQLGMTVSVDGVGNVRARLSGRDNSLPSVLSGSHVDSVAGGGDYDGVVGVVAALEVAQCIVDRKIDIARPYEVVIFSEEEGSNFGVTCAGSKAMTGYLKVQDLKDLKDQDGLSMYDRCRAAGFEPDSISNETLSPGDIHGMVELHVEQSVLLESESVQIGAVRSIAGLCQCRISFKGTANHAGSTPMRLRQDALVGAAGFISGVRNIVAEDPSPSVVGTVGSIRCEPNVSNVIPGEAIVTLDVRDVCQEAIERVVCACRLLMDQIAADFRLEVSFEVLGRQSPVNMSSGITRIISESAEKLGLSCKTMDSGAVHDSVLLNSVADTGLIFVPSSEGKSHCPEEFTDMDDIAAGTEVLLSTVVSLCNN